MTRPDSLQHELKEVELIFNEFKLIFFYRPFVHDGVGFRNACAFNRRTVEALPSKEHKSYLNKLTLTNGVQLPDPCAINDWVEDVSKLLNKQLLDIYVLN